MCQHPLGLLLTLVVLEADLYDFIKVYLNDTLLEDQTETVI